MGNEKLVEIYDLTIKLLKCIEDEYSINKYSGNICKVIFLKDILERIHEIRVIIQKNIKNY